MARIHRGSEYRRSICSGATTPSRRGFILVRHSSYSFCQLQFYLYQMYAFAQSDIRMTSYLNMIALQSPKCKGNLIIITRIVQNSNAFLHRIYITTMHNLINYRNCKFSPALSGFLSEMHPFGKGEHLCFPLKGKPFRGIEAPPPTRDNSGRPMVAPTKPAEAYQSSVQTPSP